MSADGRLLEVHKSDPTCLARFKAEQDGADRDSPASRIGTLCHLVVEKVTRASELGPPDGAAIVREVVADAIAKGESDPVVVSQTIEIMAKALGERSELSFIIPAGMTVAPEWKWALDEKFNPAPTDAPAAYAGTIDHLAWGDSLLVADYKTVIKRGSRGEIPGADEARIYVLAALAHFADARKAKFSYVFLRHGYAATAEFKRGDVWEDAIKASLTARRSARLRALETGEFPESLGVSCNYCPVIHKCQAMRAAIEDGYRSELSPTDMANRFLALRSMLNLYETQLRAWVAEKEEPIPLGGGKALGMKPAPKLSLWPGRTYEQTMADFDAMALPPEKKIEHFRFVTKDNFPSRVRKALGDLIGTRHARALIDAGGWIEENTTHEFAVWSPPPRVEGQPVKDLTTEEFDRMIDDLFGGG